MAKKQDLGITVKKDEDFSEWYTQVIHKAELIEYTDVSGCYVFRPNSYAIWENVQKFLDGKFKARGVKNAYFPLFIPEKLLNKESSHIEGFAPEVAWVTHSGNTKLKERLAIRPTSETIMYDAYSKWIRSHRDLPLLINQWCNVVRWEFNNPVPFLRSREFLWQEGHTVFATKEEADEEALAILDIYKQTYEELYAIPVLAGRKSDKEKFAGADYSLSLEALMPNGKAIQGCTSHHLGQNFSKAFGIEFLDDKGEKQFGWQNSWGFSTRSIGIMIMIHGDDKGLVIPPRVATLHVAIVPILFEKTKDKVLAEAQKLKDSIKGFEVILDDREGHSPGFKFNDWEMKGVPLRIEIGPRDIENSECVIARRDTGEKETVKLSEVPQKIAGLLGDIQKNLYEKAKSFLDRSIVHVNTFDDLTKAITEKKLVLAPWCGDEDCEERIKDSLGGVKSLNIPFDQEPLSDNCVACEKDAKYKVYFGKSY